ncbi:unnamed protein product, partial [marine sediment metagenome]
MEMKDLEQINRILQDHERRLTLIEKGKTNVKVKSGKKSLSKHIIELHEQGFFKEPVTSEEVYKKIATIYSCDFSRVKVELIRLQKRR